MTDHGVSDSDMPAFPRHTQPDVRALDVLLAGNCRPEEAPAELRPVAEVLAALQAPPDQREVTRWREALTAYREAADLLGMVSRPRSRRPRLTPSPLSAKLAAAAGAAVVAALGGGIAAAYTGSLPVALQKIAHDTIAAPGVPETRAASAPGSQDHPVGPSATGNSAYGLCNAYEHAEEHGTASQRAVAFRNLVNAAGGADKVTTFCARVQHPGTTSSPGRRTGQTGSPTAASHRRRPTTAPGNGPTTAPGTGNGGGSGGGNRHGKQ